VAVCAPDYLQPQSKDWADVKRFTSLDEAAKWATVCMGLRVQKSDTSEIILILQITFKNFRIDNNTVARKLSPDGIIMHPGPFVPGEDLHEEILADKRCVIHQQVTNGVYIRMAVLGQLAGVFS